MTTTRRASRRLLATSEGTSRIQVAVVGHHVGMSIAAKETIGRATLLSRTEKSAAVSPLTGRPSPSITETSSTTTSADVRKT